MSPTTPASTAHTFERDLIAAIPALRRFSRRLCHDRDDADDLLQTTFLLVLKHQRKFEPGTNFIAWSKIIMKRAWMGELKRAKMRSAIFVEMDRVRDLDGDDEGDAFEGVADGTPEQILVATQVYNAILAMKPIVTGILLDEVTGLSHAAMAEKLDLPINTVKSHLRRGRAQLANGGL